MLLCGSSNASMQDLLDRTGDAVKSVQGIFMAPFNFIYYRVLGLTDKESISADSRNTRITSHSNDGSEVIAIIRKPQPYSVSVVPHLNPAIRFPNGPPNGPPNGAPYPPPSQINPSSPQSPGPQNTPNCPTGLISRLLNRGRRQVALGLATAVAAPIALGLGRRVVGRLGLGSSCGNEQQLQGAETGGLQGLPGRLFGGLTGGSGGLLSGLLGGGAAANGAAPQGLLGRLTGGSGSTSAGGSLIGGLLGRLTGGSGSGGQQGGGLLGGLAKTITGGISGGGTGVQVDNGAATGNQVATGGGESGGIFGRLFG